MEFSCCGDGGKFVVGRGKRGGNAGRILGPARPAFVLIVHPSHQLPSWLRLASLLFFLLSLDLAVACPPRNCSDPLFVCSGPIVAGPASIGFSVCLPYAS